MNSKTYRRGFTLIEVLISMGVIAVGLIALVTLFPVGLRSSRLAGDFTTASFIGQQALDNIRATAQVYDPGDTDFDNTNNNGLGYFELPVSAVKGYLSPLRFPTEPVQAQTWTIIMDDANSYSVSGSLSGSQGSGNLGVVFTSDNKEIAFALYDNQDFTDMLASATDPPDVEYDEFAAGDKVVIHIEMVGGVPYYWHAMRSPVTEDLDLDGILDGRLPDGNVRPAPHNQVQEDIGLDLVPDFYDSDMRNIGTGTSGYQAGLDNPGEFTEDAAFPNDPHGDNMYTYYGTPVGWWSHPTDSSTYPLVQININGTEGNGKIDSQPDAFIQNVTVIIGWREGGQDRIATFSAAIPNQFR